MEKVIYFYGSAEVMEHGGLEGLKNYARENRYQLRDADLYTVGGEVEKADEYKGAVPDHYKERINAVEGTCRCGCLTCGCAENGCVIQEREDIRLPDQTLTDPTA